MSKSLRFQNAITGIANICTGIAGEIDKQTVGKNDKLTGRHVVLFIISESGISLKEKKKN